MRFDFYRFPQSVCNYIRRERFRKVFLCLPRNSAFDKNCKVKGKSAILVGENCLIGDSSEIIAYTQLNPELSIGNNVRVTARLRLTCAGKIIIGNDVLIAPNVFITDHNHGMDPEYPGGYALQQLIIKPVLIGDGVWIGQGVMIMPGVTIGAHSIIGAGSIVTHSIPDYSVAVGSPARVVKTWNFDTKEWVKV